jgi:hypothetical protein
MSKIAGHGLSAELPRGWDGEIYVRAPVVAPPSSGRTTPSNLGSTAPVLQLADFTLPAERGDYGGGAVELMGSHNLFVSLFEHGPEAVGTALFSQPGPPWPIRHSAFGPNRLQRPLPGQAGAQWFFTDSGRAFCLYAVIGSYTLRGLLTRRLNRVLTTIAVTPP